MDLRRPVVAILVAGTPAPGLNGVISSVTLAAIEANCVVIGFIAGFKDLKRGVITTMNLNVSDVTQIFNQGGSILKTSTAQLETAAEVENVMTILEHLRVRYLVTIGGTNTARSAQMLFNAAQTIDREFSLCHVPKTIFNDLPLPGQAVTFGYETARFAGVNLLRSLYNDARCMQRWYVVTVPGANSGELTLGIGTAGAATITVIQEQFQKLLTSGNKQPAKLKFMDLCNLLEATLYKRKVQKREYGVVAISEGLVDILDAADIEYLFGVVKMDLLERSQLGQHIVSELKRRFAADRVPVCLYAKSFGEEIRAADPIPSDIALTRILGFGAVHYLLNGESGDMISLSENDIATQPLEGIINPETQRVHYKQVNLKKVSYRVAESYMIKMTKDDLNDNAFVSSLCEITGQSESAVIKKFDHVREGPLGN